MSDECEHPTSKNVSVCTVLDNINKGKNISHYHHSLVRKLHEKHQKSDKVNAIPQEEIPSVEISCVSPRQGLIGDTQTIPGCNDNKYSLDMNTTLKSGRIQMAKGATRNKKNSETERTIVWLYPHLWVKKPYS